MVTLAYRSLSPSGRVRDQAYLSNVGGHDNFSRALFRSLKHTQLLSSRKPGM